MIECKSSFKTVYVNPRGTECPVCGDKLKHQAWGYRNAKPMTLTNRLASLAITLRLCGYPFTVSANGLL
ncbi:MAG: hypothetical protein QW606_02925 [Conexivisphaerales archaeon]